MAAFIIYITRWTVCLTLLYSLFGLFLKRETLHGINRIVLLLVLIASMVLPFVQVSTKEANIVTQGREKIEYQIANVQNPLSDNIKKVTITNPDNGVRYTHIPIREEANAYILIAVAIYLAGLIVCWLRYFWQMAALLMMIHRSKRIKIDGVPSHVHVVINPSVKAPCSWMRWVILNPADVNTRAIIKHELAHIRLGHSWDMLLCELTCRMLWFVPFAWMLRQDLRDVHEYQADRRVLQGGIRDEEYQLLLIKKATSTGLQPVVNAFNQSPIKRRFKMMYRKPSRRWVALKAAYLLPLSALAVVAFARPQAISEIEEKVEKVVPTIFTGTVDFSGEDPLYTGTLTTGDDVIQLENAHYSHEGSDTTVVVGADSNLIKADLADQSEEELRAKGMAVYREVNELTDSVMQAVGARKIAEGTYVGHFQPSLNSDTVRIRHVKVLNKQSQVTMGSGISTIDSNDPSAYELTLQQGTRKGETGYYIRYMQPANSNVRNYDQKQVDPYMLSTDSVLTGRSSKNMLHYYFTPIAIERSKQETRIFLYIGLNSKSDTEIFKQQNINMYKDVAIVDDHTGDKYVCRSTDYAYFKRVKDEIVGKDTVAIFQTCLVFPPLGKRVRGAHFANINDEDDGHETFDVTALPRKGRVITQ